jgi:hypothetical protein
MVAIKQADFNKKPCPTDYYAKMRTPGCRLEQKAFEPHNKPKPKPEPPKPKPEPPTPEPPTPKPTPLPNFTNNNQDFTPIIGSVLTGGSILGGGVGVLVKNALATQGGEYSAVATEEGVEMAEIVGLDDIVYQSGTVGEAAILDEPIVEGAATEAFGEIELADLSAFAFSSGTELGIASGAEAISATSLSAITAEAGIVGAEAVAANTAAEIGIAEGLAIPLDVETFGLSSLAAAGIGAGIGAAASAGILALTIPQYIKDHKQQPSSTLMTNEEINNSINILEKSGDNPKILNMLKENIKDGRPVYNIYDGEKNTIVGRANSDTLGLYANQYQNDYTKFKGVNPEVLKAIGMNPLLTKGVGIRAQDSYFSGTVNLPKADQILNPYDKTDKPKNEHPEYVKPIETYPEYVPRGKSSKPITNLYEPVNKPESVQSISS